MDEVQEFASVWDAIEDTPEAAANMKLRSAMMIGLKAEIGAWGLTQVQAAKRLGVTQPRLNDLLRGRISRFSLDALVELSTRAGLTLTMQVDRAAA